MPRPLDSLRLLCATVFSLSCAAIAWHAFSYLYVEYNPRNPFHVSFALTGWVVPAHFYAAGLALLIAPLQLSARLRTRWPVVHRSVGWAYLASVSIGGIAGIVMAFHAQGGWQTGGSFLLLAVLWLSCSWIGVYHAVGRRFEAHRRWMLRSIALTFAGVTLRIYLGLGLAAFDLRFADAYLIAAWLCWTVNLLVVEIYLYLGLGRTDLLPMPDSSVRSGSHPETA